MADYFAQPDELLKPDERPEWHYQAGVTLENTEKVSLIPRSCASAEPRSLTPCVVPARSPSAVASTRRARGSSPRSTRPNGRSR